MEGKIKNEIEDKRQSHDGGHLPMIEHHKYFAERNSDQDVEHAPDGTKEPARWRPGGLDQL